MKVVSAPLIRIPNIILTEIMETILHEGQIFFPHPLEAQRCYTQIR
jgi:hypothetical protein